MKAHIILPEFKGEEPLIKIEYKPALKDLMKSITIEKQYEVNLYVNSCKMLNNLIYLKTKLSKEGLIILENLINVKKLNHNYNNESEEEDENDNQPLYDSLNNININNNNNEINNKNDLNIFTLQSQEEKIKIKSKLVSKVNSLEDIKKDNNKLENEYKNVVEETKNIAYQKNI